MVTNLTNEPQPDIDAFKLYNVKKYSMTFERDGDIYIMNYLNGIWSQEFNLTFEDTLLCHSPIIWGHDNLFNYNHVRVAYLRKLNDTVNKIAYNMNTLYDNGKFTIGFQRYVQQGNTQENVLFALDQSSMIYDYDTLGRKCVYIVINYFTGDEFFNMTQWYPGNNSGGTVSLHGDITAEGFYYSGFCWISRQEDSLFVYAMNPHLNWSGPRRFYAGSSNENISVNLSTKLVHGFNNMFRLRAIWEQRINGRIALVESFMDDRLTSIIDPNVQAPERFELHQNYPNPFNPSTAVTFELYSTSFIRLSVYDEIGREVAVLINERLYPGTHTANFKGDNLTSGIYFIRLSDGNRSETIKALLMK